MFAHSTQGPDSNKSPLERWIIDPAAHSVSRTVIDADSQEFPRANEQYLGKLYQYAYTMALPNGFDAASPNQSKLFKHDMIAGTRQVHDFGSGHIPGEFVFVARDGATVEDDGWLMGYVLNYDAGTTDLVILNAANFSGAPAAIVHIPHRIPPGFHGNWIAA